MSNGKKGLAEKGGDLIHRAGGVLAAANPRAASSRRPEASRELLIAGRKVPSVMPRRGFRRVTGEKNGYRVASGRRHDGGEVERPSSEKIGSSGGRKTSPNLAVGQPVTEIFDCTSG